MTTLAEKLAVWAHLQASADAIAAEIKVEVMQLQDTIKTDSARATYGKGNGSYNWEAIAAEEKANPDYPDLVVINSKTVTDWKAVAETLWDKGEVLKKTREEIKAKNYTPGTPYVSLSLIAPKQTKGESDG